jgi:hypothetical protein
VIEDDWGWLRMIGDDWGWLRWLRMIVIEDGWKISHNLHYPRGILWAVSVSILTLWWQKKRSKEGNAGESSCRRLLLQFRRSVILLPCLAWVDALLDRIIQRCMFPASCHFAHTKPLHSSARSKLDCHIMIQTKRRERGMPGEQA